MFIREVVKQNKGYKKKFIYHNLMESYRTEKGPRQRLLLSLGKLDLPREKWKALANRIEEIVTNQKALFGPDEEIEYLAQHYSALLIEKQRPLKEEVVGEGTPYYEEVDVNSVVTRRSRTIGAEHVSLSILRKLEFPGILQKLGFTDIQSKIAQLLIVGRVVYPSSEWQTYKWACDLSAIGELLSFHVNDISHNRLYNVSDLLVKNQKQIEESLYKEEKNLFCFADNIILYDLTNTYFESGVGKSKLKRFAPSKEKRNDCPVVVLGLVLNEAGFPKRSKIFRGNISEGKTLLKMVKQLDGNPQDSKMRKTVIVDAGLSKEENLTALKKNNFDYICVARNKPLKEVPQDGFVTIRQSKNTKIEARLIHQEKEVILFCRSLRKKRKEEAIRTKYQERFESDLKDALDSLHKKGGIKKYDKVLERIGRLKEKHKKIAHFYDIAVVKKGDKAVTITWKVISEIKVDERFSGSYYLRTSRTDLTEHEIWNLYILLTDIEESFRSMKSELGLRPNFHKLDKRIKGHLYITVLAYHIVNSILYLLHKKNIYMHWNTIRKFLSSQVRITTEMTKKDGTKVRLRSTSQPEQFHNMITKALSIKSIPLG